MTPRHFFVLSILCMLASPLHAKMSWAQAAGDISFDPDLEDAQPVNPAALSRRYSAAGAVSRRTDAPAPAVYVTPASLPVETVATQPALYETMAVALPVTTPSPDDESAPVDLTADSLQHDQDAQTVTATGNVRLVQGARSLKADEVSYNLATNTGVARGNVVLTEPSGDVHFADEAELNDEMKTGFVVGLQTYLADGGRLLAEKATRSENKIVMENAAYTPCDCEVDKEGDPGWQIKADKVIYHEDENRISYRNAQFELMGVPVMWTPYLSHPDGKVKQKSGFLTPSFGFDSELGGVITSNYYWALAPDKDMTTGVMLSTNKAPVALGEYRQRFEKADIVLNGSATYSDRTDSVAGRDVGIDEEWRGHLFGEGRWDINNKWRAGANVELASDDQYLRQYDFTSDDVLENELYAERFSGRDYAVGRMMAFQDVRVREDQTDQPSVFPEIITNFKGEPNALLGGRWSFDTYLLGLQRDGNGQDMSRIITQTGWQKRHVMDVGLVNTLDLGLRGDGYYITDRDVANFGTGRRTEGKETRGFAFANLMTSYPVAKPMETMQVIIEPVASLTLSPNINAHDSDIPNEDSQDAQIDSNNIFEPNRFPGFDRIEDGSHVTYGMRSGLYGYGGSYIDTFLGQSYRLEDQNNPFSVGSGLSEQSSDIVGQIAGNYDGQYGINYRFQLDSASLASQRHELDGFAHFWRFYLNTRYLYANSLEDAGIIENREQIANTLSLDVTDAWRFRVGALNDLGDKDPGLRTALAGIDYTGCCVSFSVTAQRNLTSDSSGDSGTDIMFRIGLQGLGEFQTSGDGDLGY